MKTSFSLAIIAAFAAAAPGNLRGSSRTDAKLAGDPAFATYVGRWNKDVRNTETFLKKQANFHAAGEIIDK